MTKRKLNKKRRSGTRKGVNKLWPPFKALTGPELQAMHKRGDLDFGGFQPLIDHAWANGHFVVLANTEDHGGNTGEITHLTIKSTATGAPISARALHRIRLEVVGVGRDAIEIFAGDDIHDSEPAVRHLWVLPEGARLAFYSREIKAGRNGVEPNPNPDEVVRERLNRLSEQWWTGNFGHPHHVHLGLSAEELDAFKAGGTIPARLIEKERHRLAVFTNPNPGLAG